MFIHTLSQFLPGLRKSYLIKDANPDGTITGERTNANAVDLNRNWETFDWQQNTFTVDGLRPGAGGDSPFSEPETVGLRSFFLVLQQESSSPPHLIFLHAAFPDTGLITPGHHLVDNQILADAAARQLGQKLSGHTGYRYANQWAGSYPVTGDASTWAVAQKLPAITMEFPLREILNADDSLALSTAIEYLMIDLAGGLSTD